MTYLMGFVLILDIFFWIVVPRYEWSVPLKWQIYMGRWKRQLSNKTHNLNFVWDLDLKSGEMEKRFWLLQRALPGLQQNYKRPLWIEVQIYSDLSLGQKEEYISCLQRRFSKMKIYQGPLYELDGNRGKLNHTAERV